MDTKTAITLFVTVLLAVTGYLATYVNNLRLAQRKERLERVNRQLEKLYGPLFSLVRASTITWDAFRQTATRRGPFWDSEHPPTAEEAAEWRLWMTSVFMPLNERMQVTIIEHADLLDEPEMPNCLLSLCAHVAAYQSVLKRWAQGDYSRNWSVINFPREELLLYTAQTFLRLKAVQAALLGELPERPWSNKRLHPTPIHFADRRG
jgi:hypothetical protein